MTTASAARSRYILAWELCPGMQAVDVERTVQAALHASSLKAGQRPRILSDNGSAYVSRYLKEYLKGESMEHVRCAPFHPMTQGKIERYHRSMKNVLLLEHYYSPDELISRLTEWVDYYNHQRYHESLENVRPADAYWGRQDQILFERQKIKRLSMLKRRKSGPPLWSYFSARPKWVKPSLLFSPASVHFWLTTYTNAYTIGLNTLLSSTVYGTSSYNATSDIIFCCNN
ncbi:integrase core domain-containing protein [Spirosoma spitsbergense]|uniref:integrase core domain-containing protein n=1 Tax=Spirosoma spitsbergense TaxID=431554 RepID=UPI0003AAF47E